MTRHLTTDIAIIATIDRSMPRPMITTAIPSAMIPSTETERTTASRFATVRKPGKAMAATAIMARVIHSTMRSWLRRRRYLSGGLAMGRHSSPNAHLPWLDGGCATNLGGAEQLRQMNIRGDNICESGMNQITVR